MYLQMLYLPDEDPSETNEFTCYEAKIEESEKAGSCQESNPGHLWLDPPLSHDSRTTTNPHNPLYVLPIWSEQCKSIICIVICAVNIL